MTLAALVEAASVALVEGARHVDRLIIIVNDALSVRLAAQLVRIVSAVCRSIGLLGSLYKVIVLRGVETSLVLLPTSALLADLLLVGRGYLVRLALRPLVSYAFHVFSYNVIFRHHARLLVRALLARQGTTLAS